MTTDLGVDDEMPAEFDFSNGIPNPWFVIDEDLAASRVPTRPQKISAQRVTASKIADAPRKPKKEGS